MFNNNIELFSEPIAREKSSDRLKGSGIENSVEHEFIFKRFSSITFCNICGEMLRVFQGHICKGMK
jgi:hypothetical protein